MRVCWINLLSRSVTLDVSAKHKGARPFVQFHCCALWYQISLLLDCIIFLLEMWILWEGASIWTLHIALHCNHSSQINQFFDSGHILIVCRILFRDWLYGHIWCGSIVTDEAYIVYNACSRHKNCVWDFWLVVVASLFNCRILHHQTNNSQKVLFVIILL